MIARRFRGALPLLAGLLCAVACGRDFQLPPAVVVTVSSFSPIAAWAGTPVTIHGTNWGNDPAVVQVRFGQSGPVTPSSLHSDATSSTMVAAVPDDATSGPLAIAAPLGSASSSAPFQALGLGRLRFGTTTAALDLRQPVEAVRLSDDGTLVVFLPTLGWVARVFGSASLPIDLLANQGASAVAASSDGGILIASTDTSGCAGALLSLRTFDASMAPAATVCLPGPSTVDTTAASLRLAVSGDGHQAVIATTGYLWSIALDGSSPQLQAQALSALFTPGLAWLSGSRFVLTTDDGLRTFDAATGQLGSVPPAGSDAAGAIGPGALAASPDGAMVVANVSARLELFSVAGDAFTPASAQVDPPGEVSLDQFAFSDDGARLVGVRSGGASGALLFRLETTAGADPPVALIPLSLTTLDQPNSVHASRGLFLAGAQGGVSQLSQETASSLGTAQVQLGLSSPRLRKGNGGALDELVVAATTVNRILQLKADLSWWRHDALFDPPAISALVASPASTELYALHGDEVRRVTASDIGTLSEPASGRWTISDPAFLPSDGVLALSPDAKVLSLVYGGQLTETPWTVQLLPTALPGSSDAWPGASPATYPVGIQRLGAPIVAADPSGLLALCSDSGADLYDESAALRGGATPLAHLSIGPDSLGAADFALGSLFLLALPAQGLVPDLWTLPSGGSAEGPTPVPAAAYALATTLHAAVGGRLLYAIAAPGDIDTSLLRIAVDPLTGQLGAPETPVPIPSNSSDLAVSADGSRVYVIDPIDDRVLLLE